MTATRIVHSRWAAIGSAVAITLGTGGISAVSAFGSLSEHSVLVPVTPCRVVDTRPDFQIGPKTSPLGPNEVLTVGAHGDNGQCVGVPTDAVALSLNITAVDATLPTFLTIWASDQVRPNSSHLNPSPGEPPTPNAVTTELSPAGEFDIYNKQGDVHVFVDVNGYYVGHDHADRYYRRIEARLAFESARPTSISVNPSSMHPVEEGTGWALDTYEWWHSAASATDECIVGPVGLGAGQEVTEISLVYFVPFGNPTVGVALFGVRDTPGDAGSLGYAITEVGLVAPLTPNAAYESLDVPILGPPVVQDDHQHAVVICTKGVINVIGIHITAG